MRCICLSCLTRVAQPLSALVGCVVNVASSFQNVAQSFSIEMLRDPTSSFLRCNSCSCSRSFTMSLTRTAALSIERGTSRPLGGGRDWDPSDAQRARPIRRASGAGPTRRATAPAKMAGIPTSLLPSRRRQRSRWQSRTADLPGAS
jgi:hypothetical protein